MIICRVPGPVEETHRLAEAERGRQYIAKKMGLAWTTLEKVWDKCGLPFKANKRMGTFWNYKGRKQGPGVNSNSPALGLCLTLI